MPFESNTFDGAYELEATCHSPSLEAIYYEIFRCLKPGGTKAFYNFILMSSLLRWIRMGNDRQIRF
jgi:sterol 24-C-methyltransferase